MYQSDGTRRGARRISSESTVWEINGDTLYVADTGGPESPTELRRISNSDDTFIHEIGLVKEVAHAGDVTLFTVTSTRRVDISPGAQATVSNMELWRTDGTAGGTTMLENIVGTIVLGEFNNDRAWYTIERENGARNTWSTDGTSDGTFRLEIGEGVLTERFGDHYLVEAFSASGSLTIMSTDSVSVIDLVEPTVLTDVAAPEAPVIPTVVKFNLGDELYFEANGQLWKTDGKSAKSIIELGSGIRREFWFGQINGSQYHATDRFFYFEQREPPGLFRVDRATGEATRLTNAPVTLRGGTSNMLIYHSNSASAIDLVLADDSAVPRELADFGVDFTQPILNLNDEEALLFEGSSELEGAGYWITDGTELGTYKVSELPTTDVFFTSGAPREFFQVGNSIIFGVPMHNFEQMFAFRIDALPGDLDGDGTVTFLDFLVLANDFGRTDVSRADIDGDGQVTDADFLLLANNFNKSKKSFL